MRVINKIPWDSLLSVPPDTDALLPLKLSLINMSSRLAEAAPVLASHGAIEYLIKYVQTAKLTSLNVTAVFSSLTCLSDDGFEFFFFLVSLLICRRSS